MNGLIADVRHAFRLYAATPGGSLVAVGVLGIATACVSSFLSLYSALALKPHPGFEHSENLVTIGYSDGSQFSPLPPDLVERISGETTSLDAIAGVGTAPLFLGESSNPVQAEFVTRAYFGGLRPKLLYGRLFDERDHSGESEPAVVVSYRLWNDALAGREDALGETLEVRLGGVAAMPSAFRVVGVMAADATGTFADEIDAWVPFEQAAHLAPILAGVQLKTLGLPRAGVEVEAVIDELNGRFGDASAPGLPEARLIAQRGVVDDVNVHRETVRQVWLLTGASVLLALVAAGNASLFVLARAPARNRELGIRLSVGAPSRRLARQLAIEAVLLVVVATGVGLLAGAWLRVLLQEAPFLRQIQWRNVSFDWRVLAGVAAVMLVVATLVALAPLLSLKRTSIAARSSSLMARPGLAQHVAGTTQIVVASVLAAAAIAFTWHLAELQSQRGYATADLHVATLFNPAFVSGQTPQPAAQARNAVEAERLRKAVLAIPGVEAVSIGSTAPGGGVSSTSTIPRPGALNETIQVASSYVDYAFVEILGLRLARGRAPVESDGPAVLVNERLANDLWGKTDVVGERLASVAGFNPVLGVLADVSFMHPAAQVPPMMLVVGGYSPSPIVQMLIRGPFPTSELHQQLQQLTQNGTWDARILNLARLDDMADGLVALERARSSLAVGAAVLVVILAAFGLYGMQSYLLNAGQREYAIRAAVGAGPRSIGRLVLRRGIVLGLPGLVLGAVFAFILVAWLRGDHVGAEVSPSVVTAIVAVGILAVLVLASAQPASRARRIAPAQQIRDQ